MTWRAWAARHGQTLLGAAGRLAEQPLATCMTLAVIAVALALPLLLSQLLQNTRDATAGWNQALDISVFMNKTAGARLQGLARQLRARPDVGGVKVVTADQALAEFRQASGFGDALDALTANPLPDTLIVTPARGVVTPERIESLRAAVAMLPDVQSAQLDSAWVRRLQALLNLARRGSWLIGTLLGVAVLLVVGNTVRLDILNRRIEIEVMKLVGATDGFTRRPFLYSGLLFGLGGGVLALGLVAAAVHALAKPAAELASAYGSSFRMRGLGAGVALQVLLGAGVLGWAGSWLVATRHIRAIEPL